MIFSTIKQKKKDLTCNTSILQIPIGILRILKAKLASCILKIPADIPPILKGDKARLITVGKISLFLHKDQVFTMIKLPRFLNNQLTSSQQKCTLI